MFVKKRLFGIALFLLVLLITGCGSTNNNSGSTSKKLIDIKKTMTCKKEEVDDDGFKTTSTMKITYDSKQVYKVKSTVESQIDPEYAEFTESVSKALNEKFDSIDGIDASYSSDGSNSKMKIDVDYKKVNPDQVNEAFGDLYTDQNMYSKTDYTIEQFKIDNLDGYTCD